MGIRLDGEPIANPYSLLEGYQTTSGGNSVSTTPFIANQSTSVQTATAPTFTHDFRLLISPSNPSFYGSTVNAGWSSGAASGASSLASAQVTDIANLMAPLVITNGVLFPYSPTINFEQSVDYTQFNMVHTNMDYYAYQRTPSVTLNITGKFTCQNQTEGRYALAAIHFFRVASKMYFGQKAGSKAGLPPPILRLNAYGTYMFNNLNCILKSHSFSFNEQADTVPIQVAGGYARLPALFDLSVVLTVQQTPAKMRSEFDLDAFRTGALMTKGGWI